MSKHYDVILAVLPWASILSPSIQVGLLKGVLDRKGLSTRTAHFNVGFFKFLQGKPISTSIRTIAAFHDNLREISTVSSWIFAVPPVFTDTAAVDAYFEKIRQSITGKDLESFDLVMQLRELVPVFFKQCMEEILEFQPKVVGYSCTFDQRTPSLVLAKMLKQENPQIKIVFGGTFMDGIMGKEYGTWREKSTWHAIRVFQWEKYGKTLTRLRNPRFPGERGIIPLSFSTLI